MANEPLSVTGIDKHFEGITALKNVDFCVRDKEIHALIGENGAGKSTLMKVIGGIYTADAGQVFVNGSEVVMRDPRHAQSLGISIVHQELSLFPNLNVAENIFSGSLPVTSGLGFVARKKLHAMTKGLLNEFDMGIDPFLPMEECGIAERQVVEICKALHRRARVLILDEPTSSLTPKETTRLFSILRKLRDSGIAIIYISHRLEEIAQLADRVTVLKDGQVVAERPIAEIGIPDMIRLMVGREINSGDYYGTKPEPTSQFALEVKNLTRENTFKNISFTLRKGEILGLAGLIGAGRTELALSLFGALTPNSGEIIVDGKSFIAQNPRHALANKLVYLDEDRKNNSLFPDLSVRENFVVTHLESTCRLSLVNHKKQVEETKEYIKKLNIQVSNIEQPITDLSGGNQQKVIISRLLAINPNILIFDEPTRGIDVGAKREIYLLLNSLVSSGVSIIFISSEMPEIIGMSHRVMVLRHGEIAGFLEKSSITEENIMRLASGQA